LGDIVFSDIDDIDQSQSYFLWKRERGHLWCCGWLMSLISPNVMLPKFYRIFMKESVFLELRNFSELELHY